MRLVVTTLILLCLSWHVNAQLIADAGLDRAYCSRGDVVFLGGLKAAQGGIPPYHFHWTMRGKVYAGGGNFATVDEYYFLDSPNSASPKLVVFHDEDSIFASLKVTDSLNNVAYDTAVVYYNNTINYLWDPTSYKAPADTIELGSDIVVADHFGGYYDILWSPGKYLNDSTARYPRCFTPVTEHYDMAWTNRIGCRFWAASHDVIVSKAAVSDTYAPDKVQVVIKGSKLIVRTDRIFLPCRIVLYDISGRIILNARLLEADTEVELPVALSPGLYVYSLSSQGGMVIKRGRLEVH